MLRFLGVGAQKSGTTWLWHHLSRHPGVRFPAGKEAHFWDNWQQGDPVDPYTSLFDSADLVEGDITPSYALVAEQTIETIAGLYPDASVFFLIRDPVDRAWSHARMDAEREGLNAALLPDEWWLDHMMSAPSLDRGHYEASIRRWSRHFSVEVVLFDQIVTRPTSVLSRCCALLGIQDTFASDESVFVPVFEGPPLVMPDSLRETMKRAYEPSVRSLETYLQKPLPWSLHSLRT